MRCGVILGLVLLPLRHRPLFDCLLLFWLKFYRLSTWMSHIFSVWFCNFNLTTVAICALRLWSLSEFSIEWAHRICYFLTIPSLETKYESLAWPEIRVENLNLVLIDHFSLLSLTYQLDLWSFLWFQGFLDILKIHIDHCFWVVR